MVTLLTVCTRTVVICIRDGRGSGLIWIFAMLGGSGRIGSRLSDAQSFKHCNFSSWSLGLVVMLERIRVRYVRLWLALQHTWQSGCISTRMLQAGVGLKFEAHRMCSDHRQGRVVQTRQQQSTAAARRSSWDAWGTARKRCFPPLSACDDQLSAEWT
jgi:hypothetical protein